MGATRANGRARATTGERSERRHSLRRPVAASVADAVVHDLDVRRPLGRQRDIDEPLFRMTADFLLVARWPLSILLGGDPRRRVNGVRLVAKGTTWTHGAGPELHASPESLLLLLAGRTVDDAELEGPGAETILAKG